MEPRTELDVAKVNKAIGQAGFTGHNPTFDFAVYMEPRGEYKALVWVGYGERPSSFLPDVHTLVEMPMAELEALSHA